MTQEQEINICPPNVKELIDQTFTKVSTDSSSLLGRNFGISKPNAELTTIEEFLNKNEGNYFLIKSELEDSYEGNINTVIQLKDAIKIGGVLLGFDDGQIKEKITAEELDADSTDGVQEFGNQFSGMIDSVFRNKLPKPVHVRLSACTPLNKENAKDIFVNIDKDEYVCFSSLLLIKGFETGKFGMLLPVELMEEFFGEQIHEKNTNVLVIDESSPDVKIIKKFLANTEFHVLPAQNTTETFTLLHKEKIHLVLLDVYMTDESGIEICRKIKKTPYTRALPILMTSSKPTEEIVIGALQAGARDFLVKPFSKEQLLNKIDRFKAKKKRAESVW